MRYQVDTKFVRGVCRDGQWFEGIVEKVNKSENKYYIRWYYEKDGEEDRKSWYGESWLLEFLEEQGMGYETPPQPPILDEELFTV